MNASSIEQASVFKSPRRVVVQFLLRSRWSVRHKCRRLTRQLCDAKRTVDRLTRQLERLREQNQSLQQQLHATHSLPVPQPPALPDDPPLRRHGYGPRLISLAVNLAQAVGFRGAQRVLQIVWDWWGVTQQLPHWTAIRNWVQRLGVAALQEPLEPADDWVWIVDHSNQIGPEKALVVLAVRRSQLPPPGQALQHHHVRVLAVRPGIAWKRADVAAVYAELAERHGTPRAVLCDGAVELRDSVSALNSGKKPVLVLQDFKHKAANRLEALLSRDPRFAEFTTQVARTRSAIQQTELASLTPPSLKQKARFMNLGTLLRWARMALWVLEQPQAAARKWFTPERLEERLGWLRSFTRELAAWQECQQVLERGVTFINQQGLFRGGCRRLRRVLLRGLKSAESQALAGELLRFVGQSQRRLRAGERLPLSTEILESCFALYKQLERQHAKGGFTSLLAGFAALLTPATPASIRSAFSRVRVEDVKHWVAHHLGQTLTSKRVATYREFHRATRSATKLAATD